MANRHYGELGGARPHIGRTGGRNAGHQGSLGIATCMTVEPLDGRSTEDQLAEGFHQVLISAE